MKNQIKTIVLVSLFFINFYTQASVCKISDYGAINDGITVNTIVVQKAIDDCHENGGGTVLVDGGGIYVIGTIYLKSQITLHIANGTTLQGSTDYNDYTTDTHKMMYTYSKHLDRCLIFAKNAESITIEGNGTIDGNGTRENFKTERPVLIRFLDCNNIHMNDINLIRPSSWTTAWLYCRNISISGIYIHSRVNYNGDGLDFDGCENVMVTNSYFDNSDDCICLQASRPDKPCRNVAITNCVFKTKWAGMRIGLLSRGNIESITVANCTFKDIEDSGLKIQLNEGGEMKNMTFTNLVMENVPRPIFMTFARQRACVDIPEGKFDTLQRMHDIIISNIIVDNTKGDQNSAIFLTGLPEHKIENITIKDVYFTVSGGGTKEHANKEVKEFTLEVIEKHWPEFYLTGTLPAYGIYARHMSGLTLENITVVSENEDARSLAVFDDVEKLLTRNIRSKDKLMTEKDFIIK